MALTQAFVVFNTLPNKRHEALVLAARLLTPKQIGLELGLAPVTIDKRIEGVRARLRHITRSEDHLIVGGRVVTTIKDRGVI